MSRFINETPLAKGFAPGTSVPGEDKSERIDEQPKDGGRRDPSTPRSGPSFLIILLRALSAWEA